MEGEDVDVYFCQNRNIHQFAIRRKQVLEWRIRKCDFPDFSANYDRLRTTNQPTDGHDEGS